MLARLHRLGLAIASLGALAMAVLGGGDVLASALLDKPIPGVYEATELLMVVITVLAMSSLQARRRNITVDVISRRFSLAGQRGILLLSNLIGLALFGLIAWQGWLVAWESFQVREYAQGEIQIPVFPSKILFAVGMSLLVLQFGKDVWAWKRIELAPASDDAGENIRI
jgi:TRAP-type C4-dicarboxylate transport system permease small subunit